MLRRLHNMSPLTMALITRVTMSPALFSTALVPCRALRSPQNILIRSPRLTQAPHPCDTFTGSRWRLALGGEWAALTLPPDTGRLLDILDMRRSLSSSPPYPGLAGPRSARSDKVRPILLMRS